MWLRASDIKTSSLGDSGSIDMWQKLPDGTFICATLSRWRALIGCESLKDSLAHMHLITWGCAPKFREARPPHTCDSVSFSECWCDSEWQIGWQRTKAEAEIRKGRSVNAERSQQLLQLETHTHTLSLCPSWPLNLPPWSEVIRISWGCHAEHRRRDGEHWQHRELAQRSLCYLHAQPNLKPSLL